MTQEEYRYEYEKIKEKISKLNCDINNLNFEFARAEAIRVGLSVYDEVVIDGKRLYISCIFAKYGEARANLFFINKYGKKTRRPYNSYGIELNKLKGMIEC